MGADLRMGSFRVEMAKVPCTWVVVAASREEGDGYGSVGEDMWLILTGDVMVGKACSSRQGGFDGCFRGERGEVDGVSRCLMFSFCCACGELGTVGRCQAWYSFQPVKVRRMVEMFLLCFSIQVSKDGTGNRPPVSKVRSCLEIWRGLAGPAPFSPGLSVHLQGPAAGLQQVGALLEVQWESGLCKERK